VFCQMTGFGGTTQVADELKSKRYCLIWFEWCHKHNKRLFVLNYFGLNFTHINVADYLSIHSVKPVDGAQIIKVHFTCNVHDTMPWKFAPTQRQVKVVPGETALAFYSVKNMADYPITGNVQNYLYCIHFIPKSKLNSNVYSSVRRCHLQRVPTQGRSVL
jgi:cytochrome c oxidase assembly protein Cox11